MNRTYNIDCFEGFKHLNNKSVEHVFTSPPYNRKRNDKYSHYDDTLTDYKAFLKRAIDESLRVAKYYVFFNIQKNYYNKQEVFEIIGEYHDRLIDIIIWGKTNPMPASGHSVTNAYEFILVLSDNLKSLKSNNTYTKNLLMTNAYTNNQYTKIHKAVMHPSVCRFVIENFTKEKNTILDPFMGLGTTAITAKSLGRNFIGFEIIKEYCDIANERIEDCEL